MTKLNNISFYKPNPYNKGMAFSFAFNPKDGGFYASFIRQFSWNEKTKTGSFKQNMDNPKAKKNVKFSPTEISGICSAIAKGTKWSSFHKYGGETSISIHFGPMIKDEVKTGCGLRVVDSKDKENPFSISFTNDEGTLLSFWIAEAVKCSFHNVKEKEEGVVEKDF